MYTKKALGMDVIVVEEGEAPWEGHGSPYDEINGFCDCFGNIYVRPDTPLTDIAHEIGHLRVRPIKPEFIFTQAEIEVAAWEWAIGNYGNTPWFEHERANAFLTFYGRKR